MDKCINTKHPEFIKLAKQVNMNPLILKSKIGVWQEKNNSDDFPTLEELGINNNNNIKEGVAELFDSNETLANEVYEALGFKEQQYVSKLKEITERRKLATKSDLENSQLIKDLRVDKSQPKELKPNAADNNLAAIMLYGMKMSELEDKGLSEEMMEATTLAYRILNDFMFDMNELSFYEDILLENPEYASILSTNENPVKEFFENDIFEQADKEKFEITPEQKQQAQQLYSQYLDTIFPDSKVKDIVYHGSDVKDLQEFSLKYFGQKDAGDRGYGIYLSKDKNIAQGYGDYLYNVLLNIKNPYNVRFEDNDPSYLWNRIERNTYKEDIEKLEKDRAKWIEKVNNNDIGYAFFEQLSKNASKKEQLKFVNDKINKQISDKQERLDELDIISKSDGVINKDYELVTKPEQIHILGSKQDIQGFKNWVDEFNRKNKLFQESGSLSTISKSKIDKLQSTIEYQILNEEKDKDIYKKVGQSYIFLSEKDAQRFTNLIERNKEFPKEFKVTKKITKYETRYERGNKHPLRVYGYNVYVDYYYIKSNKNKKSNLYDIVNKETGELIASKVRVLSVSKDSKSEIAKKYGLEYTPTKVFNANRSIAFALYRQKPSKAKYIAQAKKYLYDAIKFLNPDETGNYKFNLDKIEELLSNFPEEMWDYINTTYSPENSTNINASISLQNEIKFNLPKLGLIQELEKITGLKLLGTSFKNYDRSGSLAKVFKHSKINGEWGDTITIDNSMTTKELKASLSYYLKTKNIFKPSSEEENVRKYAEHRNIDYNKLRELVFGDFDDALEHILYNRSGNSDTIELSKWRESIRNYDWQSVELFSKPYEDFQNTVKERITDKFKDKKLSNGISHLEYFFNPGTFNWLNINFNNISGEYYMSDMETRADVGVETKMAGFMNPFEMKIYQQPRAGKDFLQEKEVFNRLAAILHEPFHALHALSYGTKEELELRKAFDNLYRTDFGKEMMNQVFGSGYNKGQQVSYDTLYKEFTAFATQLMLYPKQWIQATDLRSNDIYEFIEKIQTLQDKTYEEVVRTPQKIGTIEKTIIQEEQVKLSFLEKLYNYLVKALNRIIPLSKQFTSLIVDSKLVEKQVIEDVFGTVEETVTKTLKLPDNVKKSKEDFLQAMEELQSAINTLMQIDGKLFSPENVTNFFTSDKFNQETNSLSDFIPQKSQERLNQVQDKQFQRLTSEEKAKTIEQVTKEHRSITALKDLSAKLAHRIGGRVNFVNRPAGDWKGYNQGMRSVFNEAYMTPDTPFHEILAHPIIRAIKNRNIKNLTIEEQEDTVGLLTSSGNPGIVYTIWEDGKGGKEIFDTKIEAENYIQSLKDSNIIYQNLLKELETGRGKEVFDRVKRDYVYKKRTFRNHYIGDGFTTETTEGETLPFSLEEFKKLPKGIVEKVQKNEFLDITTETINIDGVIYEHTFGEDAKEKVTKRELPKYTLEEQQEEALVTLLGLMAADKLDAKKDATLISKLKELWKQISDFVKQLLRQDGIIIDELPITTTLNDLAEIMAYGNNHIILPGYKVEYSTPLGNKYETLEEVNQEIRDLANSDVEVDLSDVKINNQSNYKNYAVINESTYEIEEFFTLEEAEEYKEAAEYEDVVGTKFTIRTIYNKSDLQNFIEENKQYEQAKKIIELWKKENNIQYDPEEVYSRGQGFYSSIGAYSNLELDLLLKNLIQHIKDNKKAGGEFTISAFTKPLNTRLKHIEGTGGTVRFVIYPKSNDIKWAANTDVSSGSVWDAHKKVSKDKKSELLGVSFTKAPTLENLNAVSPNLADIIDNLSHAHNELGIELTTNNFRLEYDEDVPYSTKKLVDNINSILDQKYGKLVKPEINIKGKTEEKYELLDEYGIDGDTQTLKTFDTLEEAKQAAYNLNKKEGYLDSEYGVRYSFREVTRKQGIQPTQTRETLKESISAIQQKLDSRSKVIPNKFVTKGKHKGYTSDTWFYKENGEWYMKYVPFDAPFETKVESHDNIKMSDAGLGIEEVWESYLSTNPEGIEDIKAAEEKYTEQALINLRMAKLKEVARKYPRSLIASRVVPINPNMVNNSEIQYSKVESNSIKDSKVENKVYETDVLIGRFPFSIKGNNTYSVEFINNTSKESYPISVVNDLVYSLNKNNKGKERFVYNPTEKEGYYVINKAVVPTTPYFENKSENISNNLC